MTEDDRYQALSDAAEIVAFNMMRDLAAMSYGHDEDDGDEIQRAIGAYLHGSPGFDRGDAAVMLASKGTWLAVEALRGVLVARLGRDPAEDELLAEVDRFQLARMGQRDRNGTS